MSLLPLVNCSKAFMQLLRLLACIKKSVCTQAAHDLAASFAPGGCAALRWRPRPARRLHRLAGRR